MYAQRGIVAPVDPQTPLFTLDFDSLALSELAVKCESDIGAELNFDSSAVRPLVTVQDILDFFAAATAAAAADAPPRGRDEH